MHDLVLRFGAATLVASLCSAQSVWTVDDDQPADFTTIQAAVDAASSGDVVVVRVGEYAEFTIDGKGVAVLADDGHDVRVRGTDYVVTTAVRNVPQGEFARICGITFIAPSNIDGEILRIDDNDGVVLIDEIETRVPGADEFWPIAYSLSVGEAVEVTNSDEVVITRSFIRGPHGALPQGGFEPGCIALAAANSTVHVHDCTFEAGVTLVVGGHGRPAFRANGGTVVLRDSELRAAGGGSGQVFGSPGPGDGGPAIEISGATVWSFGTALVGGPPGTDSLGGSFGNPGPPSLVSGGGSIAEFATTSMSLSATRATRADSSATVAVLTEPGSSLALFVSFESTPAFVPGLPGFLGVGYFPIVVPIGATDGLGYFFAPIFFGTLPAGIETYALAIQVGAITPAPEFTLSNPTRLTVVPSSI